MIWKDTYKILVNNIELTFTDVPGSVTYVRNALTALIDVDSSNYGTEAATALIPSFSEFYFIVYTYPYFDPDRKKIIKLVNDFTERFFGDLTSFVNSIDWDEGCVPHHWSEESSLVGYNTSEWTICS